LNVAIQVVIDVEHHGVLEARVDLGIVDGGHAGSRMEGQAVVAAVEERA